VGVVVEVELAVTRNALVLSPNCSVRLSPALVMVAASVTVHESVLDEPAPIASVPLVASPVTVKLAAE
jgi:hypothetical protein